MGTKRRVEKNYNLCYINLKYNLASGVLVILVFYTSMLDEKEDKAKFEVLYNTYKNLMYYVANDILKDTMQAENAVSEAFLRIAKNFNKINDVNCPQTKGFVVIVVKNIAINMYNKNKKENAVSLDEISTYIGNNNVEDKVLDEFAVEDLKKAIDSLKPIYKDAILFRYASGYSVSEISDILSVNSETVKKRIQRAKSELLKILEKMEG